MDQYICQLLPSRAYSYSFHCCRWQHRKSSCSIKVWEWRKVSLGLYILDDGENTAASWAVVLNQKYNASFACNVEIWGASHCSYSLQLSHMETFNVMCVQIWSSVPFEFVRSTLLTDFWHENPPKEFYCWKAIGLMSTTDSPTISQSSLWVGLTVISSCSH